MQRLSLCVKMCSSSAKQDADDQLITEINVFILIFFSDKYEWVPVLRNSKEKGLIIKLGTHFTSIYHPGHSRIFGLIWNTVFRNCISLKSKKSNSKINWQFEMCYSWGFNIVGYRDYVSTINWISASKKWLYIDY